VTASAAIQVVIVELEQGLFDLVRDGIWRDFGQHVAGDCFGLGTEFAVAVQKLPKGRGGFRTVQLIEHIGAAFLFTIRLGFCVLLSHRSYLGLIRMTVADLVDARGEARTGVN